jgi:hypothetical protein
MIFERGRVFRKGRVLSENRAESEISDFLEWSFSFQRICSRGSKLTMTNGIDRAIYTSSRSIQSSSPNDASCQRSSGGGTGISRGRGGPRYFATLGGPDRRRGRRVSRSTSLPLASRPKYTVDPSSHRTRNPFQGAGNGIVE